MKRVAGWVIALLCAPALLSAHAVVFPRTAGPGAYEKYVLRVPNERDAPTTAVTLRFPPQITVVSFADVDGWALDVQTDSAGRIEAATWTGHLPAGRFVEFPFVAVNPREPTRIEWPATQTYAGGEVVEWTGPEGSQTPASFTDIIAAGPAVAADDDVVESPASASGGAALWIAIAALVVALISLGLALRKPAGRA